MRSHDPLNFKAEVTIIARILFKFSEVRGLGEAAITEVPFPISSSLGQTEAINEVSLRLGRLLQAPQECVLVDEAKGEEEKRASFGPLGAGHRTKQPLINSFISPRFTDSQRPKASTSSRLQQRQKGERAGHVSIVHNAAIR